MRTTTANFDTANATPFKPVVTVKFAGNDNIYASGPYGNNVLGGVDITDNFNGGLGTEIVNWMPSGGFSEKWKYGYRGAGAPFLTVKIGNSDKFSTFSCGNYDFSTSIGAGRYIFLDAAESDVIISVDGVGGRATSTRSFGIVFRATDENDFWQAVTNISGNQFLLIKTVSGTPTTVDSASVTVNASTVYSIEVTCNGSSITATLDGANTLTATDSHNSTVTKHGLAFTEPTGTAHDIRYDDFTVESIAKQYLKSFTARWSNIDLLKSPIQETQTQFTIVDKGQDLTAHMNSNPPSNEDITIKTGFQSIDDADFVTLETHRLSDDPALNVDLNSYSFTTRGVRRLLKGNIMRVVASTIIPSDLSTASGTTITVGSTTGFVDPNTNPLTHWHVTNRAYLRINDELLSYKSVASSTTFTDGGSGLIGRNLLSTNLRAHSAGDTVSQVFAFDGCYPTEALLHILLTTDDGSGHAYYDLASYDANFTGMGFGLSASEVNIEQIERKGYELFRFENENCGGFVLHEEINGLDFITDNILIPGGLYLYIDGDGKLAVESIDRLSLIENFSSVADFTKDDIDRVNGYEIGFRKVINKIEFKKVINVFTGKAGDEFFGTPEGVLTVKLDSSETEYGLNERPLKIKDTLTLNDNSHAGTGPLSDNYYKVSKPLRWLYTFGNPLGYLDISLTPEHFPSQTIDQVSITSDKIPDVHDGGVGWSSKKFILTGQDYDPLANPPVNRFRAITWEAIEKLSSFYSFTDFTDSDFDDSTMTFSSTNDFTLEANDAYFDFTGYPGASSAPHIFIFSITITPPNSGTTEHHIDLTIRLINDVDGSTVGPSLAGDNGGITEVRGIRYNSGDSDAFTVKAIMVTRTSFDPSEDNRIKIDYHTASATAISGERPSSITWDALSVSQRGEAITQL